eukprot:CCRYP_014582-RA/>CCRYP_014582-RA protein AED:0.39 eAED:0.39 QI:0/0/0/1/1/1/3/0/508
MTTPPTPSIPSHPTCNACIAKRPTLSSTISNLLKNTASGNEREDLVLTVSIGLSTLKLLRRQITLRIERHHAAIARQEREKVESCSLLLQNLQYERNYLQREIEELRGWKAHDLETMACDELGLDVKTLEVAEQSVAKDGGGDVPMTDSQRRIATPEEAVDAYLFGQEEASKLSHRDPSNHERILAKLKEDAAARSSLVDQLARSKSELKELQRKREELRGFLLRIPKKLGEIEKMGESLNGFFAGCKGEWFCQDASGASTSIDVENKIQAANRLLSGYIDAWSTVDHLEEAERETSDLGEFVGGDGMNVVAVPDSSSGTGSVEEGTSCNCWNVELTISTVNLLPAEIATLLGRTTKAGGECIKIVFSYDLHQGVVRARIASEKNGSLTGSASSWGEQHGTLSSLQESNLNQGGGKAPPLFDAALHRIETHVNTDLDQFVSQGVETTYDWILLHQLVDIVSCWDELMSVGEGNGGRGNEDGRRRRRGKDRRLVGFGEQSPFFYYRNGL